MRRTRRAVLGLGALAVSGLAGCRETGDDGTDAPSPSATDSAGPTERASDPPDEADRGEFSRVRWRAETEAKPGAPTVGGGAILVPTGDPRDVGAPGFLQAFDPAGEERWARQLGPAVEPETVAVRGGTVYAVSGGLDDMGLHGSDYAVHGLRTRDGVSRWTYAPDLAYEFFLLLGIDGDRVYVGTHDDALGREGEYVVGIDRADGSESWRRPGGDVRGGSVAGGIVVARTSGTTVGLDGQTGHERWRVAGGRSTEGAVVAGDAVVLGGEPVRAVDLADGEPRWTHDAGRVVRSLASFGETVLLGGPDLVALGPDGEVRWRNAGGGRAESAIASHDAIFVERDEGVARIDPERGATVWEWPTSVETPDLLGLADGRLAVRTDVGNLRALDPSTGSEVWSWSPEGRVRGLAVADGTLLVTTDDGWLWAVEP